MLAHRSLGGGRPVSGLRASRGSHSPSPPSSAVLGARREEIERELDLLDGGCGRPTQASIPDEEYPMCPAAGRHVRQPDRCALLSALFCRASRRQLDTRRR